MTPQLPKTMKAAVVEKAGPPETLQIARVATPHLTRAHVIIALDYASVGIWDALQRSGTWGAVKRDTILGVDGSGTVVAAASDVTHVRVGDRVYSYSYGNPHGGYYAEYVSVPADRVARVPDQIDQRVAGAIPCVALTAQSGLRALEVKRSETLLVFGASGGVGSLAVWLAANALKASVIGTARPDAQEYVRHLGAAHTIDPHSSQRDAAIARSAPDGFAAMLVTAAGNDLPAFVSHLRAQAQLAYPNGLEPEPRADGHHLLAFDGEMSREAFDLLNRAIATRTIPLRVETFDLERVADAHRRIEQGHVLGKIVLRIRPSTNSG
jgi:NADPH:quinone reductase